MKHLLIIGLLKQNQHGFESQREVTECISKGLERKEKIYGNSKDAQGLTGVDAQL